jgi:iron complex outermembrane recepter protein
MSRTCEALMLTMLFTWMPFAGVLADPNDATGGSNPATNNNSNASEQLGEIVVTAQRREQSEQRVGITMDAFSGKQLQDFGITNTSQLSQFVAGLNISSAQGGALQTISIRGVTQGDYNPYQEGPIAFYLDDVYLSSLMSQTSATFDAQRVEVLKGPQGTLFGRNATGGLVQYVTNQPTDHYTGYFEAHAGNLDSYDYEGGIGGPITDKLTFRVAGQYSGHGATIENSSGPNSNSLKEYAERFHLRYQANDSLQLQLNGDVSSTRFSIDGANQFPSSIAIYQTINGHQVQVNSEFLGPNQTAMYILNGVGVGTRPAPGSSYFSPYSFINGGGFVTSEPYVGGNVSYTTNQFPQGGGYNWNNTRDFSLRATYNLSDHQTLTSVTAYDFNAWRSADALWPGPAPTATGFDTFTRGINQYSQELRINADYEKLNWVAGLYALGIDSSNGSAYGFEFPPNGDFSFVTAQKTRSYSGFGQVDWEFAPRLRLITGLRIIREDKSFDYGFGEGTLPWPQGIPFYFDPGKSSLATLDQTLWSGKVGVNFQATEALLVYATVNRGVKAGGFNNLTSPPPPTDFAAFVFKPEVLTAYETGFKDSFADGRISVNAAAYYYDYSNYQAFQSINATTNLILNAPATVKGAEFAVHARPIDGLDLGLTGDYNDAIVKNVAVTPGNVKDVRPAFAPQLQFDASSGYTWGVTSGLNASLQADASWRSKYYLQLSNFADVTQTSYVLVNMRATLSGPALKGWTLESTVNDLNNKVYAVSEFDVASAYGINDTAYSLGRTWYAGVRYDF